MSVGLADPKSLQALPTWVVGAPIPPAVRIGKLLQGEYLINNILGEGELGVTYEAENARLKRKFAVLMLKRELKPTQGMMLQVRDDLRRAEPLQSVGVMPVKMIVDHMMIPGFATELLEGETLRARLSRGPLPPERALATVLAVARALDALHKAGSVHGDLRPENIFLVRPGAKSSFAGRVMVVEHSLHALRRRSQGIDDKLPLYKLMYRPPECLAGERVPHIGGDVFVLGAILHESLTGRPAFYDEVADFVIDNLNQPPKPIPENPATGLTAELAATLSVLVASACARDPEVRTSDMAEIILAIEQVVKGAGLTLPTVVTEEPQAAPAAPATSTASRMNRLLHRMSGVFPQVRLPPVTEPVASAPPATAAKSAAPVARGSAPPDPATPASVAIRPPATTMPPIVAPRTKVTMLLQKLSGVFPVLQVTPEGNLETLSSSDPKIAGPALASQQAQAARSSSAVTAAATAVTLRSVPALGVRPVPPEAVPELPPADAAKLPAESAQASHPVTPPAGAAPPPSAESARLAASANQPHSESPKPVAASLEAAPSAAAARAEAATLTVTPSVAPAVQSGATAQPAAAASPAAPVAEAPVPAKSSPVANALALLRLQQQARASGQTVEGPRVGFGPATPESVVPGFMATTPASAPIAVSAPAAQATLSTSGDPSGAHKVAAQPVVGDPSGAHKVVAPPAVGDPSGAHKVAAPPVIGDPSGAHKVAAPPVIGDPSGAHKVAAPPVVAGLAGSQKPPASPAVGDPSGAHKVTAPPVIGDPSGAHKVTAPPVAADPSGAHKLSNNVTAPSLAAAQATADEGWLGLVSESVTPAVTRAPPGLSAPPEHPRPAAPAATDLAASPTMVVANPADGRDAAAPAVPPKGPDTLSEIPTRPAAMAGMAPLPAYNEAKTMPALRSLPITEQATQAKLSPDLFNLMTAIKGAAPDFSGLAPASAMPSAAPAPEPVTMAIVAAPVVPPAPAPLSAPIAADPLVPAHAALTPPVGAAPMKFESLRDLDAVSIVDEEPPSVPATVVPDKSTPSRPPRVSQLIKALQQGQIDQFQALQQASGTPQREPAPASASSVPAPPTPPAATATGSQAVVAPVAASPSGPTPQGRIAPGLMALAPPPAPNGDSPWGTSSQQVSASALQVPGPVGLRGFLLRNQEVAAALIGAIFVLLIGIAFLLFHS